jgi:hypothetical protein
MAGRLSDDMLFRIWSLRLVLVAEVVFFVGVKGAKRGVGANDHPAAAVVVVGHLVVDGAEGMRPLHGFPIEV